MNTNVFFSIIIPAYQVEKYIDDCIESVLKQNYQNYEVIIVDDGSTDQTVIKSDEFAIRNSNISVIHKKNGGLSSARNVGINSAKGEYIIFLDSDDFLSETALENLNKCIEKYDSPEVVINRWSYYRDGKICEIEKRNIFDEEKYCMMDIEEVYSGIQKLSSGCLGACFFCVRYDYLKNNNLFFYEGILHEDEEWIPRMFMNARKIAYNNSYFYIYRINREGAITSSLNIRRELDKIKVIDLLRDEFSLDKYSLSVKNVMKYHRQAILFGILSKLSLYKNDELFDVLKKEIKEHVYIFKKSSRNLYRLCYAMILVVGVELAGITIDLFLRIKKWKNERNI